MVCLFNYISMERVYWFILMQLMIVPICAQILPTQPADKENATPQKMEKESEEFFCDIWEETPRFPGGDEALMKYIQQNLRYPEDAKQKGIEGRVFVNFVVEKDGSLSKFKILRSVDPLLDEEALRVVKGMPKWIPGKLGKEIVSMRLTLPIPFMLHQKKK